MNTLRRSLLGAVCALAITPLAHAQTVAGNWPEKPVRMIVNFGPGGGTDAIARSMTDALARALGQPVVVENRVGAAGSIGLDAVVRSAPDGYTLLHSSDGPILINPHLFKIAQTASELVPIAATAGSPLLLVARPGAPSADNIKSFFNHLRANPGKLTYGSAGSGTMQHVVIEMIAEKEKFTALHVPYKGSQAIMTDMLGGLVDFTLDLGAAIPFIKSGQLKLLAVASPERSPIFPDVPTLKESGIDIGLSWLSGIYAPPGTPDAIVQRLNKEIARIMDSPETKAKLAAMSAEYVAPMPPAAFAAHQEKARRNFGDVVRRAGLKVE